MISEEQLRQFRAVLGARGEATVGTFTDGLGSLIAKARAGDKSARGALRELRGALRQVEELLAITLPGEN